MNGIVKQVEKRKVLQRIETYRIRLTVSSHIDYRYTDFRSSYLPCVLHIPDNARYLDRRLAGGMDRDFQDGSAD